MKQFMILMIDFKLFTGTVWLPEHHYTGYCKFHVGANVASCHSNFVVREVMNHVTNLKVMNHVTNIKIYLRTCI